MYSILNTRLVGGEKLAQAAFENKSRIGKRYTAMQFDGRILRNYLQ